MGYLVARQGDHRRLLDLCVRLLNLDDMWEENEVYRILILGDWRLQSRRVWTFPLFCDD